MRHDIRRQTDKGNRVHSRGRGPISSLYRRRGKRLLDLVLTLAAIPVVAPVMFFLAGLVRLRLGSPILFVQERPGLHGKPFLLLKFRTMRDARDTRGEPLPDSARLTRFGRSLRSTSLDELPSLWNVLRGEMSLVGPRPLLLEYVPRYSESQMRRHDVRPGLTGWAQVRGRNSLCWEEKFDKDVWYVDNYSVALDLRILAETAAAVIGRRGITYPGEATMPAFAGTDRPRTEGDPVLTAGGEKKA
jgi:sugar transferase EpsL